MTVLEELSSAAAGVVAQVGPAVVRIGRGGGRGCGVVLSNGIVATNAHNLRGEEALVTFADGRQAVGTVAATDVDGDLAVLRVDTGDAPGITWSDGGPGVGQVVFVVTRSGGGGERVSFGMVSGTERAFRGPRGRRIKGSLEHTAPLPRAHPAAPSSLRTARSSASTRTGWATASTWRCPPTPSCKSRLALLSAGESRTRPRLGVGLAPAHVAKALRRSVGLDERDGLLVRVVEEGSPAESAGIRQGDLIVAVNGAAVTNADDLFDAMEDGAGELQVKVVRGTEEIDITVRLEPTG